MKSISDTAKWIETLGPKKYQCALAKLRTAVGSDTYTTNETIAGSNLGVAQSYRSLLGTRSCYASLEHEFLERLKVIGHASLAPSKEKPVPKLNDRAGQGLYSKLKPGFALDLALSLTHGDRRLAMALIGVCGNDDIEMRLGQVTLKDKYVDSLSIENVTRYKQQSQKTIDDLKRSSGDEHLIAEQIEHYQTDIRQRDDQLKRLAAGSYDLDLWCSMVGQDNPLTVPGSLGPDTLMSPQLREKIASTQGGPGIALPAKYYHFISAASLGCELKAQCGLWKPEAVLALGLLSDMYRGVRLCSALNDFNGDITLIEAEFPNPPKASYEENMRIGFEKLKAKWWARELSGQIGEFLTDFLHRTQNLSADVVGRKTENLLGMMAAAQLRQSRYIGGPKSVIPCTNFESPLGKLKRYSGIDCKWGTQVCAAAENRLKTWDVDFEWSKDVQQKGAAFGADLCANSPADWDVEKAACAQYEKLRRENETEVDHEGTVTR